MVADHSRKAKARRLMAQSGGKLSYTEALRLASKPLSNMDVRITAGRIPCHTTVEEATALGLRAEHLDDNFATVMANPDLRVAGIAASMLSQERDLVIFGGTGSGKSTALDAVLAASGLSAKILQDVYFSEQGGRLCRGILKGINSSEDVVDILALDDLREPNSTEVAAEAGAAKIRVIVIHAMGAQGAEQRMSSSYPWLKLRNPFYLKTERRSSDGSRTVRLIDPEALELVQLEASKRLRSSGVSNVRIAAEALSGGRDIVVFGGSGSGKSTLADSILELSQLRSLLILDGPEELSNRGTERVVSWDRKALDGIDGYYGQLVRMGADVIAVDELWRDPAKELEYILELMPKLIVVHGSSAKSARSRIEAILPRTELRNPLFIEASVERAQLARQFRIISPRELEG